MFNNPAATDYGLFAAPVERKVQDITLSIAIVSSQVRFTDLDHLQQDRPPLSLSMPSITRPSADRMIGNDKFASWINFACSTTARHVISPLLAQYVSSISPLLAQYVSSISRMSSMRTCLRVKSLGILTRRSTSQINTPRSAERKRYCFLTDHRCMTAKLTGGNGAQRNCHPSAALCYEVIPSLLETRCA